MPVGLSEERKQFEWTYKETKEYVREHGQCQWLGRAAEALICPCILIGMNAALIQQEIVDEADDTRGYLGNNFVKKR